MIATEATKATIGTEATVGTEVPVETVKQFFTNNKFIKLDYSKITENDNLQLSDGTCLLYTRPMSAKNFIKKFGFNSNILSLIKRGIIIGLDTTKLEIFDFNFVLNHHETQNHETQKNQLLDLLISYVHHMNEKGQEPKRNITIKTLVDTLPMISLTVGYVWEDTFLEYYDTHYAVLPLYSLRPLIRYLKSQDKQTVFNFLVNIILGLNIDELTLRF